VPVTARLSKRFYDTFGDDIVNELVTWFNEVDATYRGDLREVNELNFARFDAKVGQRFAEQDARIDARLTAMEAKWDVRFAAHEAQWDGRFTGLEAIVQRLSTRLDGLEARLDRIETRLEEFFDTTQDKFRDLNVRMAGLRSDLLGWMFLFWIGTAGVSWLLR
jgi:hypothetical protein